MSRRIKVTLQSVLALLGIIGMAIIAWVIPILSQIAVAASMAFAGYMLIAEVVCYWRNHKKDD